jgi:hypothetical protein
MNDYEPRPNIELFTRFAQFYYDVEPSEPHRGDVLYDQVNHKFYIYDGKGNKIPYDLNNVPDEFTFNEIRNPGYFDSPEDRTDEFAEESWLIDPAALVAGMEEKMFYGINKSDVDNPLRIYNDIFVFHKDDIATPGFRRMKYTNDYDNLECDSGKFSINFVEEEEVEEPDDELIDDVEHSVLYHMYGHNGTPVNEIRQKFPRIKEGDVIRLLPSCSYRNTNMRVFTENGLLDLEDEGYGMIPKEWGLNKHNNPTFFELSIDYMNDHLYVDWEDMAARYGVERYDDEILKIAGKYLIKESYMKRPDYYTYWEDGTVDDLRAYDNYFIAFEE